MSLARFALGFTLAVLMAPAAWAGPAYHDPKNTDADFPFQGEYLSQASGATPAYGFQIIARGKGKFDGVQYTGGLPGQGWKRGDKLSKFSGARDGDKATLTCNDPQLTAVISGGKLTVSDSGGQKLAELARVERASPTLGAKPPEGAVVLFDGKSGEAFDNGRVTEDGLLKEGVNSKQKFGSCTLHLEFRLPYQPEDSGQGRGNSGCYLQSRYEVQILDSFGLDGKNNECGGVYTIADPIVNMCFPPLTWQTYDIDYTAAQFDADGKKTKDAVMTVRHNGVVVQDNLKLTHATTASPYKEGPEPGPLHLQNHGNPVRFRNIWIVEKK